MSTVHAADGIREAEILRGDGVISANFPKVTPHDLRHTAASLAISAGANMRQCRRCSDASRRRADFLAADALRTDGNRP